MLAGTIILRQRQRISHPWLPEEAFLAEERMEITARIALLRRNLTWLLTPSVVFSALASTAITHNPDDHYAHNPGGFVIRWGYLVLSQESPKRTEADA